MWNKFKSIFSKPSEESQTPNDDNEVVFQVNENPQVSQCLTDIETNNCTQEECIVESTPDAQYSSENEVIDEGYPLFAKAISQIVKEFGKSILFDKKLLNMMADYRGYVEIAASKKIFETLVESEHYSTIVSAAESENMTNLCHRVSSIISTQNGYKEELVWNVVANLLLGLHKVDIAFISSNKPIVPQQQNDSEKVETEKPSQVPAASAATSYEPTSELTNYKYPDASGLTIDSQSIYVSDNEVIQNSECIVNILAGFNIKAEFIGVDKGHVVSVYKFTIDATKQVKLQRNVKEISSFIRPNGVRIYSSFNSLGEVNIEIPNNEPSLISMTPIAPQGEDMVINFGEMPGGKSLSADLTDLGHIAIIGDMGTGKTVLLNNILMSLLISKHPVHVKFMTFSSSVLDFAYITKIRNYFGAETFDVNLGMTDSEKDATNVRAISSEVRRRTQLLQAANCSCISDYNKAFCSMKLDPSDGHRYLPYIVVIIDELQNYIGNSFCNVEAILANTLPTALNVGCIFIATSKYPDQKVKSILNRLFTAKIAFHTSPRDSKSFIDVDEAKDLMLHGDALLKYNGNLTRFQTALIPDDICQSIIEQIVSQQGYSMPYLLTEPQDSNSAWTQHQMSRDPMFDELARYVVTSGFASTSALQRRFSIGYNRAGLIMDQLESAGIVGPAMGAKPRAILVDSIQLETILSKY
jgi:S-DNA-T family DNA segregation ATPase FtsK/SpoIIIE